MLTFPIRVRCIYAMPGRLTQGAEYVAESCGWFTFGNAYEIRDGNPSGGVDFFRVERFKPIVRVKMGRAAA